MVTFTDNFNRANSTDLGTDWVEVSGDWSIVSNQLSPGSVGDIGILRVATSMATNDNYAQAIISVTSAISHGIWCRGNSDLTSGYLWRNNGSNWTLFAVVDGSFFSIGSYAVAAASGDIVKVQAVGSTIKAFVNGVERVSVTNTEVAAGTGTGLRCEPSSVIRWDVFSAGDIVSGFALDVSAAVEVETALELTPSKIVILSAATEVETAHEIVIDKTAVIDVAAESERALELTLRKTIMLAPAVETESAQVLPISGGEVSDVAQSILNSTKKILGLSVGDTAFDLDILLYINSVFSTLNQLGVGPVEGFMIEDSAPTWTDFLGNDPRLNNVKTYVHYRVRLMFDPPQTSFLGDSLDKQIKELEWRLNAYREETAWQDPFVPATNL